MGSNRPWELQRTKIDLYIERDEIRWWWRLLATLAASIIAGGYIAFPIGIDDKNNYYRVSKFALGVFAIGLLSVGYLLSILLCFVCQSWLFLQDAIFLPCLASCAIGLFALILNLGIRVGASADAMFIAGVVVSIISMCMYGAAAVFVYRKIILIHNFDDLRHPLPSTWHDNASLISTDERQRRQLLRLLLNKDTDRAPSPDASQSTFRIDLPDLPSPTEPQRHLSIPAHTRDGRARSVPPVSMEMRTVAPYHPDWDRPPSSQRGSSVGSRESSPGGRSTREPTSRELRRAEIELWGTDQRDVRRFSEGPTVPRIQRVQTEGLHTSFSP